MSESNYTSCPSCGEMTNKRVSKCGKCGKPLSKKGFYLKVFFGLWIVAAIISAIVRSDKPDDKAIAGNSQTTQLKNDDTNLKSKNIRRFPKEQEKFVEIIINSRSKFRSAKNEILKQEAKEWRTDALHSAFSNSNIVDWVGEVREIDVTGNGFATLSLSFSGTDIYVKTWNNEISDILENTLIKKGSDLYNSLKELKRKDKIIFSGSFIREKESNFKELSITIDGSMLKPEFLFEFVNVRKQ
jgi:hypothetical protein